MSKRVRRPYFLHAGARIGLIFACSSRAELAAFNTLAHPQISSAHDIRPRHRRATWIRLSLGALSWSPLGLQLGVSCWACFFGRVWVSATACVYRLCIAVNESNYRSTLRHPKLQFVRYRCRKRTRIEDSKAKNAAPSEVAQDQRARARHGERHEALHEVARGTAH